jgi:RNA-binding motif X-linked protein 2
MNVMREISRLNEAELQHNVSEAASWHAPYLSGATAAYIFIGNLDYLLSEGDIICLFSQFGEVVDCNLIRDSISGKSKGFCFLAYEDTRSTILAIDNFNGAKVVDRLLRVDHAAKYRKPKENQENNTAIEAELLQFDLEGDKDYESRRKIIWDYQNFLDEPNNSMNNAQNSAANAPISSSNLSDLSLSNLASVDPNVARIEQLLKQRKQHFRAEEEQESKTKQAKLAQRQDNELALINSMLPGANIGSINSQRSKKSREKNVVGEVQSKLNALESAHQSYYKERNENEREAKRHKKKHHKKHARSRSRS